MQASCLKCDVIQLEGEHAAGVAGAIDVVLGQSGREELQLRPGDFFLVQRLVLTQRHELAGMLTYRAEDYETSLHLRPLRLAERGAGRFQWSLHM